MCIVTHKKYADIDYAIAKIDQFFYNLENRRDLVERVIADPKKNMYLIKVTLSEAYERKKVELIFKLKTYEGVFRNEDFVLSYMKVYRRLKPLYLAFRRLLHNLGLDDPMTGGINTFSIFLLIVGFLQKLENPQTARAAESMSNLDVNNTSFKSTISGSTRAKDKIELSVNLSLNNASNNMNLGELFLNLIHYYGFTFNYFDWFVRPYVVESQGSESIFKVCSPENRLHQSEPHRVPPHPELHHSHQFFQENQRTPGKSPPDLRADVRKLRMRGASGKESLLPEIRRRVPEAGQRRPGLRPFGT